MTFPPEIWELIFFYSEAIDLVKFRGVCKLWKELIDKILQKGDWWYRQCETDVPTDLRNIFFETINLNTENPSTNDFKDVNIWLAVYRSWVTCKKVKKCEVVQRCFKPLPVNHSNEHITCFQILSNLLAVGTSTGYVFIYDLNHLTDGPIFTADHLEYVKSLQFLRNGKHTIVPVSCSINNHVKFWDIKQKRLLKKNRGKIIRASSFQYLCIAINNVFFIEPVVSYTTNTTYNYVSHNIVVVAIHDDTVLIYTQDGKYEKYLLEAPEVKCSSKILKPPCSRIRHYYLFKPEILVYITDLGLVGFSINGNEWKEYNVYASVEGTPTSILIYAHLLFVALDTGNIHIYYCEDFEELDFNQENSKIITLDETAIISMEIYYHLGKLYLAAAQMERIHFIEFLGI